MTVAAKQRNRERWPAGRVLRLPRPLLIGLLVVTGIHGAEAFPRPAIESILVTLIVVGAAGICRRFGHSRCETVCLLLAAVTLGAAWWSVRGQQEDASDPGLLITAGVVDSESAVRMSGDVVSIPALDTIADSRPVSAAARQQPRTILLVRARSLTFASGPIAVRGVCRVSIDGDATQSLSWGDRVEFTGQLDVPAPPMNPGEFDYSRHLERSGISAVMFVRHPAAAVVSNSAPAWHPRRLLNGFRQQTVALLADNLSPGGRATAEALLLGNRGHLTPDIERDFIASGTMHLLAISGLHVGILYLFLIRLMNLLLVSRPVGLILAGSVCVLYMFLTDLRPSVVRATLFILLMMAGQLLAREVRTGALIGVTILILVIADPAVAFDTGAWLSFLAVGALGWVSFRSPAPAERPVPLDAPDWRERLLELRLTVQDKLGLSYRQMLAVTLLSAPLVAQQFHLVSLTGMLINVLLIPLTTATLMCGYVFVGLGLAFPPAAWLTAPLFSFGLWLLNICVAIAAGVRSGFVAIPDLPVWFLPVFYGLLLLSALIQSRAGQRVLRIALLLLVITTFHLLCLRPHPEQLTCTTLSVGHGNAVVVETTDGHVLLFDAGAMNRGERTADVICRFLWSRGHRMIDAIILSHADADHYNAVSGLLDRLPVGQLITTTEFARSPASDPGAILELADWLDVPIQLAVSDDSLTVGECTVDFLQADLPRTDSGDDNEASLVAILNCGGTRICLPGDLDGTGQQQLLPDLPACDFLVAPHHGSLNSNSREFAATISPQAVIVSAGNEQTESRLAGIYNPAPLLYTSREGAVTLSVSRSGVTDLTTFRQPSVPANESP